MSTTTEKYGFIKPELTDAADITATNENWDKVEDELSKTQNEVIPVERGGTGVTKSSDIYVGNAYHLAPNNCSDTDFNTLKRAGYYFGYKNMTNAGYTSEISVLEVIPYSNDWVLQRQTRLTDGVTKQRFYSGVNGWSKWSVIYTSTKHDGVPNIAYGSYTGTGVYGSSNKNTITVDFTPKLAFIGNRLILQRNYNSELLNRMQQLDTQLTVTWNDNSVSWFHDEYPTYQYNYSGTTYYYVIFG